MSRVVPDARIDPPPEPAAVKNCEHCGEAIYEGEYYYDTPGGAYCEECMGGFLTTAEDRS